MHLFKKTFTTIGIFIFISVQTIAQSDFVKGYVILNDNDSLSGYLKLQPEGDLLEQVTFSANGNSNSAKQYKPAEVKAFHFNDGNLFESIRFTDANNAQSVYFAKYLLKGYYNLYSFRKADIQYFIIKHADSTFLLYNDELLSTGEYKTKGNYQNQLLFLSRNCNDLSGRISQIHYNEKDFISFTRKINECVAPENASNTIVVKAKSITRVYVYAGAMPLGDKMEFTGRALVRISTPSISKNLSLNAGFNYLLHKTTEETSGTKEDYITNIYSGSLTLHNNFTRGIIQPYIEAGIGLAYKQENNQTPQDKSGKFGVDFIIAAGLEGYITKNLAVKADWRYELLMHYPVVGIAYFF